MVGTYSVPITDAVERLYIVFWLFKVHSWWQLAIVMFLDLIALWHTIVYSNILYRAREGLCGLAFHDTTSMRQYDSYGITKWRSHQVDHRLVNAFCELWFRRSPQVISIHIFFWGYVKDYLGPSVAPDTEQFQLQVTKTCAKRHQVDQTELLETLIGPTLNFINP